MSHHTEADESVRVAVHNPDLPRDWSGSQAPNLSAARALALDTSSSRFLCGAVVSSEYSRRVEIAAISSTAARNVVSLTFDGLLRPLIFRTNCSEAAWISSGVTG